MSEIDATERQETAAAHAKHDAAHTKASVANEPDTRKRKLLLALLARPSSWRARATARTTTRRALPRRNRRRLRQRQPRATDAASERHGDRGERRRHADRQGRATRSSRSTPPTPRSRSRNAEATLGQTVRQVSSLYVNNDVLRSERRAAPVRPRRARRTI